MNTKLSYLTSTDKIRLAAELDDDKPMLVFTHDGSFTLDYFVEGEQFMRRKGRYDQSYDAIIPLIQKQVSQYPACCHYIRALEYVVYNGEPTVRDWDSTWEFGYGEVIEIILSATPSQLLDALLVATGKAEL